jgi:YVTN family beta-propeller protein
MPHRRNRLFWLVGGLLGYALIVLAFSMVRGALASRGAAPISPTAFNRPTYSSPIAISQDNALVWVVNPDDDSVSVIRTSNNTLITKIGVGDEPQSIAVDPNLNFVYVANAADNTVTVIQHNNNPAAFVANVVGAPLTTGAEPWNIVISPDGNRVFVANSGQDTITVINTATRTIIGSVSLAATPCNDHTGDNVGDPAYHFQPRGMAITQNNTRLYVTRFLSFTKVGGKQATNDGKEGVVCKFTLNTAGVTAATVLSAPTKITLAAQASGFPPNVNELAYPNQMQSIVIRGTRAYLPNIAAAPAAPLAFNADTQAYVNEITNIGGAEADGGAINLHLGARNPEAGKIKLFFANPWAIAFTTQSGVGNAYVVSAGSDLLVKLNVDANGTPSFTVDADTTRYIDLNDPANPQTSGLNAGKNPLGIVIKDDGSTAYVMNDVSRNVSIVNLASDSVTKVVRTAALPPPDTLDEILQVGKEIFFSSRGHFDRPAGTTVSTENRLSTDGWQNCASCHFAGLTDANIWQFGSGPRKAIPLNGTFNPHNPDDQRILNYSAIFDEVEDFEANVRNVSGPGNKSAGPPPVLDENHGLIFSDDGDINKAPDVVNNLPKPNAGRPQFTVTLPVAPSETRGPIAALDALKEWIRFAVRTPNGPLTTDEISVANGGLSLSDVNAGRTLFFRAGCQSCHGGGKWTNSTKDFESPPPANDISKENNPNANGGTYLNRFLENINSFNLNVLGQGNALPGQPQVGAIEKDAAGKDALGKDQDVPPDGKGNGFNVPSLLGIWALEPYYHNGACETLACVLADQKHRTGNGLHPDVLQTQVNRDRLAAFLKSLDAETAPATNLYIDRHDIFFDPPTVIAGTTATVGVNISLFGLTSDIAQPLTVRFFDGSPALNNQIGSDVTLNAADFNQNFGQATKTVLWNVPSQPGIHSIYVTVDATNLLVEDNEDDNTAARRIRTRAAPPDRTPPVISNVAINNGDAVTNSRDVTVTFNASDPASPSPQTTSGVGSFCIVRYSYDTRRRRWVEENCSFQQLPAANPNGSFTVDTRLRPREGTAYVFVWVKDNAGNISSTPGFDVISFIPSPTTDIEMDRNDIRIFRITLNPGQLFEFTATPSTGDVDLSVFQGNTRVALSAQNGETPETVSFGNATAGPILFQVEVRAVVNSRFRITTVESLAALAQAAPEVIAPGKTPPTEPLVSGPPALRAAIEGAPEVFVPFAVR